METMKFIFQTTNETRQELALWHDLSSTRTKDRCSLRLVGKDNSHPGRLLWHLFSGDSSVSENVCCWHKNYDKFALFDDMIWHVSSNPWICFCPFNQELRTLGGIDPYPKEKTTNTLSNHQFFILCHDMGQLIKWFWMQNTSCHSAFRLVDLSGISYWVSSFQFIKNINIQ